MNDKTGGAVIFRAHDWYNENTGKTRYGVQAEHNGKWLHVGKSGKNGFTPKFFRTPESRATWINERNADARMFGSADALKALHAELARLSTD